jgi:CMP-N,N'-diacetyllegionaminic acid synthase
MIDGRRVLAVITARGGSKGVPRKNIRKLAGKPLIAWTIEAAKKSKYIDRLILSSDDDEIMEVSAAWGCEVPFKRPSELSQDNTPGIEPVLHAVEQLPDYDYVVLLQPTSPLRTSEDIDGCIEKCVRKHAPACVSVTETEKSPFWMFTLDSGDRMRPILQQSVIAPRRQDLPHVYVLNGAVYVARTDWLKQTRTFLAPETIAYEMPRLRSADIDAEADFLTCEYLIASRSVDNVHNSVHNFVHKP